MFKKWSKQVFHEKVIHIFFQSRQAVSLNGKDDNSLDKKMSAVQGERNISRWTLSPPC
jgi:hypothetical protein